ncbi:MAG: phospholipid carrier-dependent glycosyltransferase [Acidobacteria bacterium]|nr:phospholipid carrier-dependent glycosyltransferase [Acidobacteriota bacterium]
MSTGTPGWGMNYLVALIYLVTGPNPLAAQSFCAVIGAATSPLVYICSMKIFHNRRVGKLAALLVAFLPAFIIWSGQLLKDGLIIFLLVLAMTMVIRLQKNFSYVAVAVLIFSLFGILSLRFYIFYMVAVSVAGSFIIGQSGSAKSMARGLILLVIMGVALTYLGVLRTATDNFEKFGDFERLQASRSDMAKRGDSGFGEDLDVSTAEGAVVALPIGLLFLMLAPFPWQATSLRQAITMPEMFVWWAMIPLIFTGLAYTIRHKLREAIPILIFTLMLTIAYSIFQGNVGTAYRQRTQIQVFLFMFIAVGWTLMQEKRENHRAARLAARQKQEAHLIKRGVEG